MVPSCLPLLIRHTHRYDVLSTYYYQVALPKLDLTEPRYVSVFIDQKRFTKVDFCLILALVQQSILFFDFV
jgi:hypothetical protein